ncbi:MAG: M60 family metallopeptidase [Planctomycetota bacterium]|jgi:hypothetical protein
MMISTSKRNVLVWWLTLCLTLAVLSGSVQAQEYSKRQLHMFNVITKGVKTLSDEYWAFTAIAPLKPDIIPLFWGDHKAYTGDIRWPQNSYPPVAIASEYQEGRFIALGHDGLLIDPSANEVFTANILNWLGNGYKHKKVAVYTHLGRWFNKDRLSAKAKELLGSRDVEIIELGSKVTDEDLKECDLFIIVRPSRIIDPNEIGSIVSYVGQGGSLLMTGMGWFWEAQNKTHDISDFPLNRLGEHLGFEYSKTSINKAPRNNKKGLRRYSLVSFRPLASRKPVEVKNYSIKEHSNSSITRSISQTRDKYHYVVEGEHVIVSMPYRFFKKCKRPAGFIAQLDVVYELYADFTDGIVPFDGEKILILNVDNLKFHMSSGNPILSRQDRIEYILGELEKSNYKNPSWGLMHELGHDFIIGMKHRFVFGDGDNESWAEFFALYGCQVLGLEHKETFWKAKARAYHESGEQDFERIKKEKWMMIGFLHHIQEQYSWDVYRRLLKRYAELVRENDYPDINKTKKDVVETQKKVDLFVKELSLAAGANLYPYFDRWGFPVNRPINKELEHLPKAQLFK